MAKRRPFVLRVATQANRFSIKTGAFAGELGASSWEEIHVSSTAHIKSLDGVRGIAILAVVLCHAGAIVKDIPQLSFLGLGTMGVDLFFALSGFLITSILIREREQPKYFRNFYYRRAMRIWPLYYTYILFMYGIVRNLPRLGAFQHLVAHSAYLQEHPLTIVTPLAVSLLFAQNLWVPSLFCFRDLTSITWSLCIEEQFYLFWPVAVRFLSQRSFTILLFAILIASPFLRLLVFAHGFDGATQWQTVYRFPFFHFDAIAAGSLFAILRPKLEARRNSKTKLCAALAVSVLVLCVVGTASAWSFSAAALMSVSLIGLALSGVGRRVWEWRPLTFLGFISYGLYLIHPTIFDLLQSRTLYRMVGLNGNIEVIEVIMALFAIVLSIGIATLSRCTVEAFFLGIKDRRSRGEREKLLLMADPSGVR